MLVQHAGEGKIAVMPLFVAIKEDMDVEIGGEAISGHGGGDGGGPTDPREGFEAAAPGVTSPEPG